MNRGKWISYYSCLH